MGIGDRIHFRSKSFKPSQAFGLNSPDDHALFEDCGFEFTGDRKAVESTLVRPHHGERFWGCESLKDQ
jgi:hypothetical protein